MTQTGIDTWATRFRQVLAEVTGSEPAIRRTPIDRPPQEANAARTDMIWWASSGSPAICIGVKETDAELLAGMRAEALPAGTPDAARANLVEILNRSLGHGEFTGRSPIDAARWELCNVEFADGGKLQLFVAQAGVAAPDTSNLDMLMDIELPITLRFGRTQMALRDIVGLGFGSVIEFDRGIDDPVEVLVNGHVVARGEAVIIKGSYGVRISDISSRRERLLTTPFATAQDSREAVGEQIG